MANKKKLVKAVLFLIPLAGIAYFAYDYFAPQTPTYMTVNAATRDIKSRVFASGTLAGKIEVDGKRIDSTNLVIQYTMTITNNGNVAGYAKKIVDYVPDSLSFSSSLNNNWYASGNTVVCTSLENELINPGESKEVKLLLTKKMDENGTGTVTNKAEITETYNDQGLLDATSENDDTNSSANVIIGIKTGGPVTYILLTVSILAIVGCGAYIINKKVLKV